MDQSTFEKLLSDPNAKASDDAFKRYVMPGGRYAGVITGATFGKTSPRDKTKTPTDFIEVQAKYIKPLSVEPSRVEDAKKAIVHIAPASRVFYITPNAISMWTDWLIEMGFASENPLKVVSDGKLTGKPVIITIEEAISEKSGKPYNPNDSVAFAPMKD